MLSLTHIVKREREFWLSTWGARPEVSAALLLASFCINALSLIFPLILLQVYDRIIPNAAYESLMILLLLALGTFIFDAFLRYGRASISTWADLKYEYHATSDNLKHLLNAKLLEYEKEGVGTHYERVNAITHLKDFYGSQVIPTLFDLPFLFLYLLLIAYLGGNLVWIPVSILVVYLFITYSLGSRLQYLLSMQRSANERRVNFIIEVLKGIFTAKVYAMEAQMMRRYEHMQKSAMQRNYALSLNQASAGSTTKMANQITMGAVVAFGAVGVINGEMTVGAVAACTLIAGRTLTPVNRFMEIWVRIQTIRLAQERLEKIEELEVENKESDEEITLTRGQINIRNVSYRYPETNKDIVSNISLDVKPGEMIAITGKPETGKTTLFHLLTRVIEPTSGSIEYDGKDITNVDVNSLRLQASLITQEGIMLNGTIMENLTLFDMRPERIKQAKQLVRELRLSAFIDHLPKGYDTEVGARAVEFVPRGVKQCLVIIRALMNEPKVILFDEANISLDRFSDQSIQELLVRLKGDKTIILVSHRPSLINLADRAFTMEDGQLRDFDAAKDILEKEEDDDVQEGED